MTRLLVVNLAEYADRDLSVERQILGSEFEIHRFTYVGKEQQLVDASREVDCILTDYTPFNATVISALNTCKLISVAASGYSGIDIEAAAKANISVCAIDEYCTDEVADHTMLLLLALARKLKAYDRQVQEDHVWRFDTMNGLQRLHSKTLALIGFGRIGQAVAKRATGFGLNVIAHDPYADRNIARELNVNLCDLHSVFAHADIVSLHCAATADNRHLINHDAFKAMKKSPILVNVARGSLIDEAALIDALDSGQISGMGVDVLESESPDLKNSGLLERDNVLLTPHMAFYSDASILDSRQISSANIRHFFDGEHDKVRSFVHPPK